MNVAIVRGTALGSGSPSVSTSKQISSRALLAILRASPLLDVPWERIFERVGVNPRIIGDPRNTLPIETVGAIWDEPARLTGNRCFGLHAAERAGPLQLELVEYGFCSSLNLRDACSRVNRYRHLFDDDLVVEIPAQGKPRIVLRLLSFPRFPTTQAPEFALARIVILTRVLFFEPEWSPVGVRFQHDGPTDTSEHERVFGCPVRFGCEHNEILVPARDLDRRFLTADPMLGAYVASHADRMVERLARADHHTSRVRQVIDEMLKHTRPTLALIADEIGTGTRSVQRRLREEGTHFREILDQVRQEKAALWLEDGELSVTEVARRLGFSEPASFNRAFRRWTGMNPSEFARKPRK